MEQSKDPRETGEWHRVKKQILKRDQYRCQNCGMNESEWRGVDLHVHHIKAVDDGGSNRLENLVALCKRCHNAAHVAGPVDGEYPVSAIPEREDYYLDSRGNYELTDKDREFIRVLKQNGPTQKKDILEQTSIEYWEFQRRAKSLMFSKYIGRVKRGVYGYISREEYERAKAEVDSGKPVRDVRYEAYVPEGAGDE
ncbi:HNH endonuclease [Haloferax volcanii]|uniref:HNH endonuclease n=1 Tax=Haloferax volcanii TaxID=2246 RepID=UPI00249C4B4F|nr:HNH endonuclease signature motif containing protein [Haloferax alexandrinus]WEL29828.1 Restriction endonuclease, McrA/HNH family [Haloferax alexandrinus]